jgi:hypothetical protein
MPTPASNQNEPSKMKKLIGGGMDESIHAKLATNGANAPRTPVSHRPVPPASFPDPEPRRREPRLKFLQAFWTIASLISLTVNIILIVILLILFQMLGTIQSTADDKVSGLLGGLYSNFVKMDQARIQRTIHVEKEIPVQFSLNVSGPTSVTLTQPVTINGALVTVQTGGLNIVNARATIVLPQDTFLPINIHGLTVPIDQKIPVALDVLVDIPLNETQLHDPFTGLQQVVRPWYCLVEPNAMFNGSQVCPSIMGPTMPNPTPVGTVIP